MLLFILFGPSLGSGLIKGEYSGLEQDYQRDPLSKSNLVSIPFEKKSNQISITIGVGTPEQSMKVIPSFETSYIWISSNFDSKQSSTYKDLNIETWVKPYKVKGSLSTETITLDRLEANDQAFVLSNDDEGYDNKANDGIFGLGPRNSSSQHSTFIETLKKQEKIRNSVFSIFLNSTGENSLLRIGDNLYELLDGDSLYKNFSISAINGQWVANVIEFSVLDTYFTGSYYNYNAVFSLNESKLVLPRDVVSKYFRLLRKKKIYCDHSTKPITCPCSYFTYKFPVIKFKINEATFDIQPENFMIDNGDGCDMMLEELTDGNIIFGLPFFYEFYSVFDLDNSLLFISHNDKDYSDNYYVGNNWLIPLIVAGIFIALMLIVACVVIIKHTIIDTGSYRRLFD